jgi:MFS family permease
LENMLSYDETDRNLKTSIKEGVFSSIFTGFTKNFIAPLAIALKASNSTVALFSSVPEIFASIFQLSAITASRKIKSRKKMLVIAAIIQAVIWIPIVIAPFIAAGNIWLLLGLVTLATTLSQFMQPIWNSYMGDLVPVNERGRFFGNRNVIVGMSTFISTVAAGLVLNHYSGFSPLLGFTIIFSVAIAARFGSVYFKARLADLPPAQLGKVQDFSLWQFMSRMTSTNYGLFVIFIALMKFSVYIAAPFFAIFMLRELGFSYLQFTAATGAGLICSFIFMRVWGNLIDARGSRLVLYITGILVVIPPLIYLGASLTLSGTVLFTAIVLAEAFSGMAWAGFDLSAANFIFDSVRPEKRIRCISYYNLFIGVGIFLGTGLGSLIVDHVHLALSGMLIAFIVSAVLRLAVSFAFLPKLKEVRLIEVSLGRTLFHRILDIRPRGGFDVVVIDKGPIIIPRKAQRSTPKPQPKIETKQGSTIDLVKQSVLKYYHRYDKPERPYKSDQKAVQHIMDEMKRGKYPDEFRKK